MKKIIKIAGVIVATEAVYALGKGHLLAWAKVYYPETGEDMYKFLKKITENPEHNAALRLGGRVTLKWCDLIERFYKEL